MKSLDGINFPEKFKVKLPARETPDLEVLYDFLFNFLGASWASKIGHYAYVDAGEEYQIAPNQDGFLYCFMHPNGWLRLLTADSKYGDASFAEFDFSEVRGLMIARALASGKVISNLDAAKNMADSINGDAGIDIVEAKDVGGKAVVSLIPEIKAMLDDLPKD